MKQTLRPTLDDLRMECLLMQAPALDLAKLRQPHSSFPHNPLLAEPLYLTKYIERMGTGTRDMIAKCRAAGLPEPEFRLTDGFVTTLRRPKAPASVDQATAQATKLVKYLDSRFLEEFAHALNLSGAQVTAQATTQVAKVLAAANREAGVPRDELQNSAAITHREHFRKAYLEPLLSTPG